MSKLSKHSNLKKKRKRVVNKTSTKYITEFAPKIQVFVQLIAVSRVVLITVQGGKRICILFSTALLW